MLSDQGCQYSGDDWRRFCRKNRLEASMSGRDNGWDNAVAEPYFASLKKEHMKKRIYNTRVQATEDAFDYIESFNNPHGRRCYIGGVSPDVFEAAAKHRQAALHEILGTPGCSWTETLVSSCGTASATPT